MAPRALLTTHQSAIPLAENATLVDKDIVGDRATLGWSDEPEALFVREPFDASLQFIVRHGFCFSFQ